MTIPEQKLLLSNAAFSFTNGTVRLTVGSGVITTGGRLISGGESRILKLADLPEDLVAQLLGAVETFASILFEDYEPDEDYLNEELKTIVEQRRHARVEAERAERMANDPVLKAQAEAEAAKETK